MRRIIAAAIGAALAAGAATCGQKGPLTPKPPPAATLVGAWGPSLGAQASRLHAGGTPALPAPDTKDLSYTPLAADSYHGHAVRP